jgi:hypothetical protein
MKKIKAKITGKKVLFLTAAILFFSLINPGFSQEENRQKTIVEKVEVNWWQVPIFAVDKHGSPKGASGWERNRTTFTYKDYQFFDVKVEVSLDK